MSFKPMLASPVELDNIKYPVLASPKLDGVRAVVINGVVFSRSLKKIPNEHVQSLLKKLEYFDGELIVGPPTSPTCYTDTESGVMRASGKPDVRFYVFDHIEHPERNYTERVATLTGRIQTDWCFLPQTPINDNEALLRIEAEMLLCGYEGIILRDPLGHYKFGRSTAKEGLLLKLKRFMDSEAEIIDFAEEMFNGNEASTDELGRTKRSSHQAGKRGKSTLGAFIVRDVATKVEFSIGTGLTRAERKAYWEGRDALVGALIKYKYFPIGVKDAPRHPVFLGFRDKRDL